MANETRDSSTSPDPADLLAIGDLAQLTGISPDTIRVWERRYGRPTPVRLPSGHRRYTQSHVRWLRRMAEAMAHGHRPSKLVNLSEAALDALLFLPAATAGRAEHIEKIIALVRDFRAAEIAAEMRRASRRVGPEAFVADWLGPLLDGIGRAWADGEIEVRHEHFLSEILDDVVRSIRASMPDTGIAPVVILATLSGESHGLGLQMVAMLCALHEVSPRILGTNTPNEEIVGAVVETGAVGVALSVSLATGGIQTDREIAELRRMLPRHVRLVVGGRGARDVRRGPRGVDYVTDVREIGRWLQTISVEGS